MFREGWTRRHGWGAFALAFGVATMGHIAMAADRAQPLSAQAAGMTPTGTTPAGTTYEPDLLADTNYAIPNNAFFVSPTGSDASAGTLGAPFATVGFAVNAVPAGVTIVLRGGTYRESLGGITKLVTLQAYPHEQPWIDGSVVVDAVPTGSTWTVPNWNPSMCRTCFAAAAIDPMYPMAGAPDQVFVDGVPQRQVGSASALSAGTFYVDTAASSLVLGTNPTGRVVEATQYERAVQFNTASSGSILRGIGFRRFAAHQTMDIPAAVVVNTTGITVDHVTVAWSATRGISVLQPGAVVVDNRLQNNGMNGFHANAADGLVFVRNRITFSNFEHFNITPSASAAVAGAKITATAYGVARNNVFADNASNGFWLDVTSFNWVIANNASVRNAGHGIAVELSGTVVVAGNLVADNARIGIKVAGANNVDVWNNSVVNNQWAQIGVYEDARTNANPANGVTWDTKSVTIANNVFSGPSTSSKSMFDSFDGNSPKRTTTQAMVTLNDRNLWNRPVAAAPANIATWQYSTIASKNYTSLASWHAGVGREGASIAADNLSLNSIFVSPASGNYRLAPFSPARASGLPLPTIVSAAMNTKPSTVVRLGALFVTTG